MEVMKKLCFFICYDNLLIFYVSFCIIYNYSIKLILSFEKTLNTKIQTTKEGFYC